ncbi:MAG: acyloxyacyl hydrolase [Candidatus Zixiibacteriota bacterium]
MASSSDLSFRQAALELGYGEGIDNTKLLRLNLQWTYSPPLFTNRGFEVAGIAQLGGGIWRGDRDIVDISATPVFRLQGADHSPNIRPYFEAAIGFHYISDIQMRQRVLSTNFQFGDHLGIGVVFGKSKTIDVSYLFQHLSNASIKRPNSGINFHILRIGYSL